MNQARVLGLGEGRRTLMFMGAKKELLIRRTIVSKALLGFAPRFEDWVSASASPPAADSPDVAQPPFCKSKSKSRGLIHSWREGVNYV